MNIRRASAHGLVDEPLHEADDGSLAREVLEAIDLFFFDQAGSGGNRLDGGLLPRVQRVESALDLLARGYTARNRPPECELQRPWRVFIERVPAGDVHRLRGQPQRHELARANEFWIDGIKGDGRGGHRLGRKPGELAEAGEIVGQRAFGTQTQFQQDGAQPIGGLNLHAGHALRDHGRERLLFDEPREKVSPRRRK